MPPDDVDDRDDDRLRRGRTDRGRTDSGTKTVLIVLAVIGGLMLVGVIGCLGLVGWGMFQAQKVVQGVAQTFAATAAAESFLDQLKAGPGGPAYDGTSAGFKAAMTREQFDQFLAVSPILTRHQSRTATSSDPVGPPPATPVTVVFRLQAPPQADDPDGPDDELPGAAKPKAKAKDAKVKSVKGHDEKGKGAGPPEPLKDGTCTVTVVEENGVWKVNSVQVKLD